MPELKEIVVRDVTPRSEKVRRTEAALTASFQVREDETHLSKVLQRMADQGHVDILVDGKVEQPNAALKTFKVSPSAREPGLNIEEVLARICCDNKVGYFIDELGVIKVVSEETAAQTCEIRLYDVTPLINEETTAELIAERLSTRRSNGQPPALAIGNRIAVCENRQGHQRVLKFLKSDFSLSESLE